MIYYSVIRSTSPHHNAATPSGPGPPQYPGFTISLSLSHTHTHTHTHTHQTLLDEWWAQCTDLYLTTGIIHKGQTSMPPAGFEPTIPASEWKQTHASDRTAYDVPSRNVQVKFTLRLAVAQSVRLGVQPFLAPWSPFSLYMEYYRLSVLRHAL